MCEPLTSKVVFLSIIWIRSLYSGKLVRISSIHNTFLFSSSRVNHKTGLVSLDAFLIVICSVLYFFAKNLSVQVVLPTPEGPYIQIVRADFLFRFSIGWYLFHNFLHNSGCLINNNRKSFSASSIFSYLFSLSFWSNSSNCWSVFLNPFEFFLLYLSKKKLCPPSLSTYLFRSLLGLFQFFQQKTIQIFFERL